jgi:hypothetical protein
MSAIDSDDDDYLQSFCKQLLTRDYFIRSAKLVDNVGHLIAAAYRQGLVPLIIYAEQVLIQRHLSFTSRTVRLLLRNS